MINKKNIVFKNYSRVSKKAKELGIPQVEVPNLLAMQIDSFDRFLQRNIHPQLRKKMGLQAVFESVFPIQDQKGIYSLEFNDYSVLKEKYNTEECNERNLTYKAPVKARMKLTVYDEEILKQQGEKRVKKIIEQEIFLGEIPLITENGTFIINGAERVIISQLHRSPGVFFTEEKHPSGKMIYSGKIIPYTGSWLEFSLDVHDTMYVHIDKKKKIPVTVLLRTIGLASNKELTEAFLKKEKTTVSESLGKMLYSDLFNPESGEEVYSAGSEITEEVINDLLELNFNEIDVVAEVSKTTGKILFNTFEKDTTANYEEAVKKIYTLIRPGENPTLELAEILVERMFFNSKRYSLGEVGRYKLNNRLDVNVDLDKFVLTKDDLVAIVNKLIEIYKGEDDIDDIDHLSNRRIRTVGELLESEYTDGLNRVIRIATERMAISNSDEVTVHDLINSNALIAVIDSFFLTGQLSQFMEQTNPLASLTHKRRFTALGPGGLTRERAGFEVRDVHYSHYGRICPVETPEGPNIGLIASPALFSRVNKFGFLETPYVKIEDGKITQQVDYLSPSEEDKYTIAQADININKDLVITDTFVFARQKGEYIQVPPSEVHYMEVAPQQIISVSAALIPFLEHDDANRALMGSNMQRQAVPLLNPSVPVVGTGMEELVAKDGGVIAKAPFDGIITKATSQYIDIKRRQTDELAIDLGRDDRIWLKKYQRSNQDTCVNQRPVVHEGQLVKKGEMLSDGPCIADKRLALGQNMLVAFMPWYGYNYEDAIILSERVAMEDMLTSIYIEEKEVLVRNVKNGKEELAYDIPNVPTKALRNLDKTGIIRTGSLIKHGDIIVGKITPKSVDIDPSPEENLMRALFGDRAGDFTNTSLKAKPGMEGVVVDVKVFSRLEDKSDFAEEKKAQIERLKAGKKDRKERIEAFLKENLSEYLIGQTAKNIADVKTNMFFINAGEVINELNIKKINFKRLNLDFELVEDADMNLKIYNDIILKVKSAKEENDNIYKKERDRLKHGDELAYGVRKMVKVYIAKKRKIQVGDKMAGRHGNKGVISTIAPIEDMPFMENGETVDIILNPLGVPSRMNIGQIMETHLGMAAKILGFSVETPVFDGAKIEDIHAELKAADLPLDGKHVLYDGKTGEAFKERVTVGYIYMLKLNHLVADKMHARSTGPYSLITQQPLGGKAQHGGQRLGEMEVWALEAYGASRLLEEMLTIKSDDVDGRTNAFKAITSGQNPPAPGIPESFNVLVSELKSLGFNIDFLADKEI
ncbi:MAG: DNA-directed RNA polymerase subunit beta [Candidatus Cloacimonadota bacterium]|nr:MAG: DNA-directed RNA polymerase subunit beta [Candidatus Cloacimonadota bacterium]